MPKKKEKPHPVHEQNKSESKSTAPKPPKTSTNDKTAKQPKLPKDKIKSKPAAAVKSNQKTTEQDVNSNEPVIQLSDASNVISVFTII